MDNTQTLSSRRDISADMLNKVLSILDDIESYCEDTYYWPYGNWTKENIERLADSIIESANNIREVMKEVN